VSEFVRIPGRFNGPLGSGNGGYSSGVIAGFVEGPAEVSLRSPVPLERPLEVIRGDDLSVRVLDGETLVAEAQPAKPLDLDVPAAVTPQEARAATSRYRGLPDGEFSRCFVCGRARDDAFGVFAGAVDGREVVASPWTPTSWSADPTGTVLPEFVWAVLDCPTYFATYLDEDLLPAVLARVACRIEAPVVAGEEHVVIAWPIEAVGRKRHAGSALLSRHGKPLALSRALLIERRAG
jgi:hypothetical protein